MLLFCRGCMMFLYLNPNLVGGNLQLWHQCSAAAGCQHGCPCHFSQWLLCGRMSPRQFLQGETRSVMSYAALLIKVRSINGSLVSCYPIAVHVIPISLQHRRITTNRIHSWACACRACNEFILGETAPNYAAYDHNCYATSHLHRCNDLQKLQWLHCCGVACLNCWAIIVHWHLGLSLRCCQ